MVRFYLSKFSQYVIVILFAITLNFFLPRLMPGDPLQYIAGEDIVLMSAEQKQDLLRKHGLDKPALEQYLVYISGLLQGDLGYSYKAGRSVGEVIAEKLPWTVRLALVNILLSTIIGVSLGSIAAWNRGKSIDIALNNMFVFMQSMPSFWIGMILISVFGAKLGWLPIFGAQTVWARYSGIEKVLDIARHMVMPLTTLVILSVSSIYLTMRYSMINVLGEDYILMVKMKGLADSKIRYMHAMRNAMIPVVTTVMLNLGHIVGGSTIVETVFSYPGMGKLLYDSVLNRDYPVIQGCFLIITICVIVANLISDILYPFIDPKVA